MDLYFTGYITIDKHLESVAILFFIWEVQNSNLGPEADYLSFPQSLLENSGIVGR
jgi:hypothetical protein